MTRVLVTGAGGFVGRQFLTLIRETRFDIEILPSFPDITDADAVEQTITALRPDVVFHFAAVSSIGSARLAPERAWEVNLHGTLNVARAIRHTVSSCLLVFASSAEAYGDSFRSGMPLSETAALAPGNTYSATKAAADLALGALAHDGLQTVRVRPFNHTGAGQAEAFVVPAFARQLALIEAGQQEPVISVGNLEAERDFLDVKDVCAAYLACLDRATNLTPGAIFNLCSEYTRSIRSVLDDLLRISGLTVRVEIAPEKLRPVDIPRACGNSAHARAVLGWKPRIAWDDTLSSVLADWRERVRTHNICTKDHSC